MHILVDMFDPIYLYFAAMALALIASFKYYNDRRYILFIPLLGLSLGVELYKYFILKNNYIKDHFDSLFIAVEYSLLSIIISNFIVSKTKKNTIRFSPAIVVPIFLIVHFTIFSHNHFFKFVNVLIASPLLCIWTIVYLFEVIKQDEEFEIFRNPMFWISLGNLLFFSGSFFSYGFGNYMLYKEQKETAESIFWIARILNILLYILYFIGFTWDKRRYT